LQLSCSLADHQLITVIFHRCYFTTKVGENKVLFFLFYGL